MPPGFWAHTVAMATKTRNAARRARETLASAEAARAMRLRLTSTSHAANRTAAPTRAKLVRKYLMPFSGGIIPQFPNIGFHEVRL